MAPLLNSKGENMNKMKYAALTALVIAMGTISV
jgi:hypothetical protein